MRAHSASQAAVRSPGVQVTDTAVFRPFLARGRSSAIPTVAELQTHKVPERWPGMVPLGDASPPSWADQSGCLPGYVLSLPFRRYF